MMLPTGLWKVIRTKNTLDKNWMTTTDSVESEMVARFLDYLLLESYVLQYIHRFIWEIIKI